MPQRKSILEEDVTASPRRSARTSRSMCDSPVPLLAKLKENFKQKIALQNDDNSSNEDSSKSSNTPVRRSTRFTSRESSVEPESTEVIPQRRVTRSMSKSPTSLSKTTGTPKRISKRKSSISDKAEIKVVLQQLDIITEIETEDKNVLKQNDQKTSKLSEDVETNEDISTDKTNVLEGDGGSSETKETEIEKNNTYDTVSKTSHDTSGESQEFTNKKEEDQLKKDVGSIQEKNDKNLEPDEKQRENLIESTDKEIESNNQHTTDTNVASASGVEHKSSSETDKAEFVTESTEDIQNNSTQDIKIEANGSHSPVVGDKMTELLDFKDSEKTEQLVVSMKSLEVETVEKESKDSEKGKSFVESTTDLNSSNVSESTEKTTEVKGMDAEVNTSKELPQLKIDVSDEKTTSATAIDLKDDQDENTSNILIVGNTTSSPQSSNGDCIPKEFNFNLGNSDSNRNTEEEDLNLSLVNDDGHSYSPICKLKDVPAYTENTGTPISKINDKSNNSTPIKPLEKIKTPQRADFSPIVKNGDENKTPRVTPKSETKITKSPIVEESFTDIQPKKSGSKKRRLISDSESDIELVSNPTKKNRSMEAEKLSEENMSEHEISSSDSMAEGDGNKNKFIDDMAVEVSGEDTPSDGSNDIIEVGESIGSTESEIDSDESYERDSFVVEDDEASDRLLSSDDEVEKSIQASSWPHKSKRIITVSSSEDEETDNLSTQPFGGKSPSIVSVNQISSTNSDIESIKNRNKELSQMIEGVLEVKPSVPKGTEESKDPKPVDKEEKEASSDELKNENNVTKEVKAVKKSRLSEKSFVDIQEAVSKYITKQTNAEDGVTESKHNKPKNNNSSSATLSGSAKKGKKGKNESNLEDSKLLEDFHDITNKEAEISTGNAEEMEKLELSMNTSIIKDIQKGNKKEVVLIETVECSTPKVETSEKKTKLSNSGKKKRNKNKIKTKDCLDETNALKDFFDSANLTGSDLVNRNEQDVNTTLTSLKDDTSVHQVNESFRNTAKKRKSLENEQCDTEIVKQSSPTSEQSHLSESGKKKRKRNKNESRVSLDDSVVLQAVTNEGVRKNYVSLPATEMVHAEITPKKQPGPTSEQSHPSESSKKKRKLNKNKSQSSLDDSVVLQNVIEGEEERKNYVKMLVTTEVNTASTSKKTTKSRKRMRSLNKNTSDALNDSNTLKDFFKMATKENIQDQEKCSQKHDSTPTDNDNNKKIRKSLKSDSSSYDESVVGMYVLNTVSRPRNSDENMTIEENTSFHANQQIQVNKKKRRRSRKTKKSSVPDSTGEILVTSETNEKSKTKNNKRFRLRKHDSDTSVEQMNKQENFIKSKKLKTESIEEQIQTESTSNLSELGHTAKKDKNKRHRLRKNNKKPSESETYTSNENLSGEGQIPKVNTVKNVNLEKSASSNECDNVPDKLNKKSKQFKKSKTHDKEATNVVKDNDQVPTKKHKKKIIQSLSVKQKSVALNKTEKENVDVPRTQMNFSVMKDKNSRASLSESNNRNRISSIPKYKNLTKPSSVGMTSGGFSVTNFEIPIVSNKLNKIKKRKAVPDTSSLSLQRKAGHINLLQECLRGPSVKRISSKEFSKLKSK